MSQDMLLILIGALAGGFVNGLTGFGTGLTAMPFWLHALPPVAAGQLVAAASVAGQLTTIGTIRHAIGWRHVGPIVCAGLLGVPLGLYVAPMLSVSAFKLGTGLLLIVYCSFMLTAAGRFRFVTRMPLMDLLVGFLGGILGGIAGLSGVLTTMWATVQIWTKDERRALMQAFNLAVLLAMLLASLVAGRMSQQVLLAFALALPATLSGAWLGAALYRRLDDDRYQRLVLALLLVSGFVLVLQSS